MPKNGTWLFNQSFKDGFVSENGSCVDSPHIDFVEPFDFPLPLPQKVVARDFTLPLSLPNLLKDWEGISAFFLKKEGTLKY